MRLGAAVAVVLVLASPAFAAGGKVSFPAPKVGQAKIELLTIKATQRPTIVATNMPALGHGFGAAVALGKSPTAAGTYLAYVVMFMGNLSTSPASTVNVTIAGGTPAGAPKDESNDCPVVRSFAKGGYANLAVAGVYLFTFGTGSYKPKSPWTSMATSDAAFMDCNH